MRNFVRNIANIFFIIFSMLYINGCKVAHTDPVPSANNSSYIPGTTCVLSEVKYFSIDNDSLIGGMQFRYSSANKLANVLYYKKGQQPGDNGYQTLTYNTDETLKEIIIFSPSQVVDLGILSATIPAINLSSKYHYTNGKLTSAEIGKDNSQIFSQGETAVLTYTYGYYPDGNLQYKVMKYSSTGVGVNISDSTVYENYVSNRPQNSSDFYKSIGVISTNAGHYDTTEVETGIYLAYEYDQKSNKVKSKTLSFKVDSLKLKAFGASANEINALADSINVDMEVTFDLSKANMSYAFRFLNPENPNDIDVNLPVSIKSGCLILTNNYTFNASGLPDKLYTTFSYDGACGDLGATFNTLNGITGNSIPVNNTYTRYYYTGCK